MHASRIAQNHFRRKYVTQQIYSGPRSLDHPYALHVRPLLGHMPGMRRRDPEVDFVGALGFVWNPDQLSLAGEVFQQ